MRKPKNYPNDGVLFLDIDGVLCTKRAQQANRMLKQWQAFDPIAIQMIKNLCDDYQLRIVASSTWRIGGNDVFNLKLILGTHGLDPTYFWKDWATPRIDSASRGKEIRQWLDKHPTVTRFLIFDDIIYDFDDDDVDLLKRVILTDEDDGITAKNYTDARNKLQGMT